MKYLKVFELYRDDRKNIFKGKEFLTQISNMEEFTDILEKSRLISPSPLEVKIIKDYFDSLDGETIITIDNFEHYGNNKINISFRGNLIDNSWGGIYDHYKEVKLHLVIHVTDDECYLIASIYEWRKEGLFKIYDRDNLIECLDLIVKNYDRYKN